MLSESTLTWVLISNGLLDIFEIEGLLLNLLIVGGPTKLLFRLEFEGNLFNFDMFSIIRELLEGAVEKKNKRAFVKIKLND